MEMVFKASRFWSGMFSWTKLFMPDTIRLLEDRLIVYKRALLGLWSSEDEIMYNKVASVRLTRGIFTASVVIETHGAGVAGGIKINKFWKKTARTLAEELRKRIA
jgi:hypothetical protein